MWQEEHDNCLKKQLSSRSGMGLLCNEVVKFRKSTRFEHLRSTSAKAMAGLPEYGCSTLFRKCSKLKETFDTATTYRLFEMLEGLSRRRENWLTWQNLRGDARSVLKGDADIFVRGYVGPYWAYMR